MKETQQQQILDYLRAHRVEVAGEVVHGSTMPANGGDPDPASVSFPVEVAA